MAFVQKFVYQAIDQITPILRKIKQADSDLRHKIAASSSAAASAVDKVNNSLKANKAQIDKIQASWRKYGDRVKEVGGKIRAFGGRMTRIASTSVGLVAGLGVRSFAKLEKGLVNTINLLSDEEIVKWGDKLRAAQQRAIEMGFSIEDVNKGLFDTISALGASASAMDTYKAAQQLAIAGNTNLTASINGLTSIVNAYGRETTNVNEVANALFSAQVKGKITVEELANNIGKVAPIAKVMGISFQEATAGLAAMTLGGLNAELSATALRAALNILNDTTGKNADLLRSWGVPVGAIEVKAAGLSKTLKSLNAAFKAHPEQIQQAIPNIRAFVGAATLTDDKLKILDATVIKMAQDVRNGTGMQAGYNRMMKTSSQELAMLKGQLTLLSASLGREIMPVLRSLTNGVLIPLFKYIKELSPTTKKWIGYLAVATVTIGPLALALGSLTIVVGGIIKALAAFKITAIAAFAVTKGGAVAATAATSALHLAWLPILAILGKIAVAAGLAFGAFKFGQWVAEVTGLDKAIASVGNSLGSWLKDLTQADNWFGRLLRKVTGIKREMSAKKLTEATKGIAAFSAASGKAVAPNQQIMQQITAAQGVGMQASGLLEMNNRALNQLSGGAFAGQMDSQTYAQNSQVDVNIGIKDPGNYVQSTKSRTQGRVARVIGINRSGR